MDARPQKPVAEESSRFENEYLRKKIIKLENNIKEREEQLESLTRDKENMNMENEALKEALSKLTLERDNMPKRVKELEKQKTDIKKHLDATRSEKDNIILKFKREAKVKETIEMDLHEQKMKLQEETNKVVELMKMKSTLETILHNEKHRNAILLSKKKALKLEFSKAKQDHEIELAKVKKILEQVNKDADKYRSECQKQRQETEIHKHDTSKELEQMKKMIAGLTNFIALQADDHDGNGAVVIVSEMKGILDMKDPTELECGLNAIYNLITEKNREKIKRIDGLEPKIDGLTESDYEYVRAAAKRTLFKIRQDRLYPRHGRGTDITCKYFILCKKFMETLQVDDSYMDALYNCCYCTDCHSVRGDRLYYARGDPAKDYGIPIGWARFALGVNEAKATTQNIWDDWHVAFHGTVEESVIPILGVGYLVNPGDIIIGGKRIGVRDGHIPDSESVRKIFMSPSIRYAGDEAYATSTSFTDPTSHITYEARVVLQIKVLPGSYEVREQTICASRQIDPGYLNAELEWCTNQHGSTVIYGILIKLE